MCGIWSSILYCSSFVLQWRLFRGWPSLQSARHSLHDWCNSAGTLSQRNALHSSRSCKGLRQCLKTVSSLVCKRERWRGGVGGSVISTESVCLKNCTIIKLEVIKKYSGIPYELMKHLPSCVCVRACVCICGCGCSSSLIFLCHSVSVSTWCYVL